MRHTNRRADGDGLWIEPQWWSEAGTCRKPRGSTARSFIEASGIHFVYGMEDVKFGMTKEELENWRYQFGTSNRERMGLRVTPFVFTWSNDVGQCIKQ